MPRSPQGRPATLQAGDSNEGREFAAATADATIATAIDHFVQNDASDGFILVPHITPGGLDEFAHRVVPLLQEPGAFRTKYEGTTLRDNLGITEKFRPTAPNAAEPVSILQTGQPTGRG